MGRGSGNPEGTWTRLSEYDPSDLAKLATDLVGEGLARISVRLATFVTLVEQGFDTGRRSSYQPCGTPVEPALLCAADLWPSGGNLSIEVALRAIAEPTIDQAQSVANARQP